MDRARLLDGNWLIRPTAGLVFKAADFQIRDEPPGRILATVRFWDRAASKPDAKHSDPDWTRGVRMSLCEGGALWIDGLESLRASGRVVSARMRATAERDGHRVIVGIWQDTGGAGKTEVDTTMDQLGGYTVKTVASFAADTTGVTEKRGQHRSSKPKRVFANAWSPWVEKHRVFVLRSPWAAELVKECDGFPDAKHDDIVDAISGGFQLLVGQGLSWWSLVKKAAEARPGRRG